LNAQEVLDTGARGTALVAGAETVLLTAAPGTVAAGFQRTVEVEAAAAAADNVAFSVVAAAAVLPLSLHSRDSDGAVHSSGHSGRTRESNLPGTVCEYARSAHILCIWVASRSDGWPVRSSAAGKKCPE